MAVIQARGPKSDTTAGELWADFIEDNLERFRKTVRVPVGKRLGCGLFGCVFESESPWVVKFTRDETEGPIWALIAELLSDPEISLELDGLLRVRDVVRIRPDVMFEGEEMPVFGIVREEALPVIRGPGFATPETLRRVGVTPEMLEAVGMSPSEPNLNDMNLYLSRFPRQIQISLRMLFIVLLSLREYQKHALVFHSWRGRLMRKEYAGLGEDEAQDIADASFQAMLSAIETMRGDGYTNPYGDIIGLTLSSALQNADLVFRDLHLLNVGWRVHEDIEGDRRPLSMVILDPGAMATPYSPDIREIELAENRRGALPRH
jgi:hypothetical protein